MGFTGIRAPRGRAEHGPDSRNASSTPPPGALHSLKIAHVSISGIIPIITGGYLSGIAEKPTRRFFRTVMPACREVRDYIFEKLASVCGIIALGAVIMCNNTIDNGRGFYFDFHCLFCFVGFGLQSLIPCLFFSLYDAFKFVCLFFFPPPHQ